MAFLLPWYLHRLKFAWFAQRRSSFEDIKSFCSLVWESSNVFVLFSHKFLCYRLMRYIKAIQLYVLWLFRLSAFFSCKKWEITLITSGNQFVLFPVFLNVNCFRCSTPFTAIPVFRMIKTEPFNAHALAWNLFLAGEG